jgi:hypothetical protein
VSLESLQTFRIVERINLVSCGDDGLVGEPLAGVIASRKQLELARDDVVVHHRIASACR